MSSEVGSGQVAIVPTFKGFRKAVSSVVDTVTGTSSSTMSSGFTKAGAKSGSGFASGFKSTAGSVGAGSLKGLSTKVAKFSREVSSARLKEQDATGKLRLAEAQLAEARGKYSAESSQVVRAEERVASAQRTHLSTQSNLVGSTDRLAAAQKNLASATSAAATQGTRSNGVFAQLPSIFGKAGSSSASSFGSAFKSNVGQIFTGAALANVVTQGAFQLGRSLGDAVSAGVSYGIQGVELASNLEQSNGAIVAVFKDQSDTIFKASKTAATGVGISRSAYLQYSTIVGAQLKNLGLPIDQVSGKTNELITLGADLAAQFGGPTSDAVGALSSLLRGERDPIERYGVGLKQVDIDARKAKLGLNGLTGEAEKQANIQATLSLLWEQTADAQGTFFRESDTYAHKTQVLNAQLEESKTKLGEALLPAFSAAASFANETLIPALDGVISAAGPQIRDALAESAPLFAELADSLSPLVSELVTAGTDALPGFLNGLQGLIEDGPEAIQFFKDLGAAGDEAAGFLNGTADALEVAAQAVRDGVGDDNDNGIWDELFGLPKFDQAEADARAGGAATADALAGGLLAGNPEAQAAYLDLIAITPETKQAANTEAILFGKEVTTGFSLGIQQGTPAVIAGIGFFAGSATSAARKAFQIKSPSRLFRDQIGFQVAAGAALGVRDGQPLMDRAVRDLATLPAVPSIGARFDIDGSFAGSSGGVSSPRSATSAVRDINITNPDPYVVLSMVKQELDGRLALK